jgi:polysaccharide biosynthesis/export protein
MRFGISKRILMEAALLAAFVLPVGAQAQPARPAQQEQAVPAETPKQKDEPVVAAPVDPKTYKIGAEDVLMVRVWKEPDLSGNVMVRPDGRITLPLVGEIVAANLTPEQLTASVNEAFSKFLNKPEVIISVLSVQSKKFYVSGNVIKSGPVPLVTPTTVLQALSAAGFKEWAKKNKIVIMRGNERLKFNYNEVIKGKNLAQNVNIQDGDHIFVP